jgi:hypothetical protein
MTLVHRTWSTRRPPPSKRCGTMSTWATKNSGSRANTRRHPSRTYDTRSRRSTPQVFSYTCYTTLSIELYLFTHRARNQKSSGHGGQHEDTEQRRTTGPAQHTDWGQALDVSQRVSGAPGQSAGYTRREAAKLPQNDTAAVQQGQTSEVSAVSGTDLWSYIAFRISTAKLRRFSYKHCEFTPLFV